MLKKLTSIMFICFMTIAPQGFCEETIEMGDIPILEVNQEISPNIINTNQVKNYDTFIEPARETKPTLNFNLSNIKKLKKGSILPNDNSKVSIGYVSQYFKAPYDKVFSHLVSIVDNSELEIISFDSSSGRIFANYKKEKPLYITVSKYNQTNVLVKITPADGVYDLPPTISSKIFAELNRSLAAN